MRINELIQQDKLSAPIYNSSITHMDYPRIPTGIFPIDYSLAGGLPTNVISQFYGPPGGFKTTLSYLIVKAMQNFCMNPGCMKPLLLCQCEEPGIKQAVKISTEGDRPDALWLYRLGFSPDQIKSFLCALPEFGEQAASLARELVAADDLGLIIVDSVANMTPLKLLTGPFEKEARIGEEAKLIKRFIQALTFGLRQEQKRGHNIAVLLINQMRSIIDSNPNTPSTGVGGGYALKHGYRLSLYLSQLAQEKEDKTDDNLKHMLRGATSLLGPASKVQLLALAGKSEFKIMLDGTDDYAMGAPADGHTLWLYANEAGMINKVKGGYVMKIPERANQGNPLVFKKQNDFLDLIKSNSPLANVIRFVTVHIHKKRFIQNILARNERLLNIKTPNITTTGGDKIAAASLVESNNMPSVESDIDKEKKKGKKTDKKTGDQSSVAAV